MTDKPRYTNRIYYSAGLISLVLLPILCLCYLNNRKAFRKERVMEINWWSDNVYKYTNYKIPYFIHPERKFIDINLTANDKENKIKLDFAQLEIRQMVSTKDTINAVHFYFADNAKYWTLIRAFDICNIEKAKMYVPKGNDVWVFYYTLKPKVILTDNMKPVCGNAMLLDDVVFINPYEQVDNEKSEVSKYIFEIAKKYSVFAILFMLMTFLAIRKIFN